MTDKPGQIEAMEQEVPEAVEQEVQRTRVRAGGARTRARAGGQ